MEPTIHPMPAIPRTRDDKFNERRAELGQATLETLATLGYARTSLREIAQNSPYSHGVLHYYFSDKVDLILCSVRQYKSVCVTRYDTVSADAHSYAELLERFCDKMAETLRDVPAAAGLVVGTGGMSNQFLFGKTNNCIKPWIRTNIIGNIKTTGNIIERYRRNSRNENLF